LKLKFSPAEETVIAVIEDLIKSNVLHQTWDDKVKQKQYTYTPVLPLIEDKRYTN
jgi:hypothetical protein